MMVRLESGSGLNRFLSHLLLPLLLITTLNLSLCQAFSKRDDVEASSSSQGEQGPLSSPMYVSPDDAKDQCKRPCVRKCCPVGQAFYLNTWTCTPTETLSPDDFLDIPIVPGLPVCTLNFSQTSFLAKDGKGRLKIGSYAVSHEAYCTDEIFQHDGSPIINSLVCDESLGDSKVINVIRKTSIFGNVLSVVCVAIIFALHMAKPKLNKRLGVTFLFFCAAIFFKGIHESFGRLVKFSAYPTYTACVVNSILLMYARASVPIWLNVLCVEIARRAWFLHRGSSHQYNKRRYLIGYLLYGLGFPFLQCLIAGVITTLSSNTQKQSSIYDRTCIFTDRDVRNNIFLYPSIAISFLSAIIILHTYRYKKPISSLVSGKTASCGRKNNGGSGGTVEGLEFAEEQREERPLLANFTSEEFVSEFWQQVGLVCFWVLLRVFMLCVQLTGRGVLSHITYFMDSFQGFYVFLIFLCNGTKRQIMKNNMRELVGNLCWRKLWSPGTTEPPQGPRTSEKDKNNDPSIMAQP